MKELFLIVFVFAIWFGGIYFLLWRRYGRKSKATTSRRRFKAPVVVPEPTDSEVTESDPCAPDPGYPHQETVDFDCQSFLDAVKSGPFLFKPVVQLGVNNGVKAGASLDIVWAGLASDGNWKVEVKCGDPCDSATVSSVELTEVNLKRLTNHTLARVSVTDLTPGQRFEYQVYLDDNLVFKATANAPFDQHIKSHRFAVVGDMGTGGAGEKKIASRIWDARPD